MHFLFGKTNAISTFENDFHRLFHIIHPAPGQKLSLRMKGDVNKALKDLEGNVNYGILEPLPELSPIEVEKLLRPPTYEEQKFRACLSNTAPSRRVQASLIAKGFARENFYDMPKVRNPIIPANAIETEDVYTDSDNELRSTPAPVVGVSELLLFLTKNSL